MTPEDKWNREENALLKHEQLERELVEAQRIIEGQRQGIAIAQELIKVLTHQNYALLKTNTYLRGCPLPLEPVGMTAQKLQWNNDVQHYESHLQSNPPEEFK